MAREDLLKQIKAFAQEAAALPSLTLRGGNAIDAYGEAPPYDALLDEANNA